MTLEFKNKILNISNSLDSISVFSSGLCKEAKLCLLSKLQNRISILENSLIVFSDCKVGSTYDGYTKAIPLINQNATHLKNDEELQINVGIAFLNYPNYPKVFINNDTISSSNNGFFSYKMKISGKPGKYHVPIKVEYFDYTEKIMISKFVEYYID